MSQATIINKSLMPEGVFVERGQITNLNAALEIGTYQVIGNTPIVGLPQGAYQYGNLVVYGGLNFRVQEYYPHRDMGYAFYVRIWYNNQDAFTSWRGIMGVVVSNT